MRKFIAILACLLLALPSFADDDVVKQLITGVMRLGGEPQVIAEEDDYVYIRLTDSTWVEMQEYSDSIVVILTACAPQCSSCARVYNKEWILLRTLYPPFQSIFPLARIQQGRVAWKNNDDWEY